MPAYWREELQEGACCCIRGNVIGVSNLVNKGHILESLRGWHIHVPLGLDAELAVGSVVTLFQAKVTALDGSTAILWPTEDFQALVHSGEVHPDRAIELCCGLGGLSVGANAAGFQTVAGMDISKWALQVFQANHRATAIQGSVCEPHDVARLFNMTGKHACGYLLGFPCPPFSSRGDQLGFSDARAWVFVAGLDVVYLLNGLFLVLECTPQVEAFQEFVQHLNSFVSVMNWQWTSRVLHLDDAWPTRRTRWWALVVPEPLHQFVKLDALPYAPHLKSVSDLVPVWPLWSPQEEELLKLTDTEIDFLEEFAVLSDLLLRPSSKCPTLLHSLGHHDRPCPCGCRNVGLSRERLERDGLSAVFVQCSHTSGLRHLHASEAGLLCGLPPSFRFLDIRKALPLIGQTASPLQAQWVLLALRRAVQLQQNVPFAQRVEMVQSHVKFQDQLQHLAMHLWPTRLTKVPRTVKLCFDNRCILAIQVEPFATIEDLITAQKSLGGWGSRVQVTCRNMPLPHQTILQAITYDVVCYEPRQLKPAPENRFVYALFYKERHWVGILAPGTLLGVLLMELGFAYSPGTRVLSNGFCWTWGDFLWTSFHGELIRPEITGAGPDQDRGLSNLQLDLEVKALCQKATLPTGFVMLSIMDFAVGIASCCCSTCAHSVDSSPCPEDLWHLLS